MVPNEDDLFNAFPCSRHPALEQYIGVIAGDVAKDEISGEDLTPDLLRVGVDDFTAGFEVARMPKVFGPGLIRFQSFRSWMSLIEIDLRVL